MKKIFKYFSPAALSYDISLYGYNFSIKQYIISIVAVLILVTLISLIFQLKLLYILCIAGSGILVLPLLIRRKFVNNHRMKEFSDVDVYLHQMIYSFIRTPKIYTALSDTYAISEGQLKQVLKQALEELEYGMEDNVYNNALNIITKAYNCSRVKTLHRFLINIETKGGRYKNALHVLLTDFDKWVKNIYQYEYDLRQIKRDTTIGIFISIFLASVTMFMCSMLNKYSTDSVSITDDFIFQISTTVFIILCILFYAYTQSNYGKDILNSDSQDKTCIKDYNLAYNTNTMSLFMKILPVIILMIALSIFMFIKRKYILAVYLLISIITLIVFPLINKRSARKRVIKNLRINFSDWLRNVAVNLENKPLIAAIEDTYDDCPYIIRQSLDTFIRDIEADPADIRPYYDFLSEYRQSDITSTIRTLYSVSELDEKEIDETINTLIQRNNELINKQTNQDYKDKMSVFRFMEYIPVFLMAFKMSIDMMLIITIYL